MRSFTALAYALNRQCGNGQQVAWSEHVTAEAGGQAIVDASAIKQKTHAVD